MNNDEIEKCADELARVETLEQITALEVSTEAVFIYHLNDEKVKALAKLRNLKRLIQDGNSRISDAGLKTLGSMLTLEELDLEWSENVTDIGLAHLHQLINLTWLDISFCVRVTSKGIAETKEALPDCEILTGRA